MNTPHTLKPIRVTVPVTPEVLALFQRLSGVSGKSVGRLMGEWLDDTQGGLEPMIDIMTDFKNRPKEAIKSLQLHANALTDMTADVVKAAMRLDGETTHRPQRSEDGAEGSPFRGKGGLTPPSSNTGGKVPSKAQKTKGV